MDWFKKNGKTAEDVAAKTREIDAGISEKEALISKMRAELPDRVLEGDNLATHRIEHEELELNALKVTKAALDAKARELQVIEARDAEAARFEAAAEQGRHCSKLAEDLIASLAPALAIADALDDATSELAASISGIPFPLINLGDAPQQILSARPTRLTVLAVQDPEGLEKAIASVVSTMLANAQSIRERGKPGPSSQNAA